MQPPTRRRRERDGGESQTPLAYPNYRASSRLEVNFRSVGADDERARVLRELAAAARAACPGIELPEADFAAYLEARAPAEPEQLARLHAADLYLACACIRGDRDALERFDKILVAQVSAVGARTHASSTFAD